MPKTCSDVKLRIRFIDTGATWIRHSHSACARALTKQPITATRPGPPSRVVSRGATSRANGSTISGPGAMASPASTAE